MPILDGSEAARDVRLYDKFTDTLMEHNLRSRELDGWIHSANIGHRQWSAHTVIPEAPPERFMDLDAEAASSLERELNEQRDTLLALAADCAAAEQEMLDLLQQIRDEEPSSWHWELRFTEVYRALIEGASDAAMPGEDAEQAARRIVDEEVRKHLESSPSIEEAAADLRATCSNASRSFSVKAREYEDLAGVTITYS